MIIAKCSGKALDIPGSSFHVEGTHLIQWTAHGGQNQLFTFEHVVDHSCSLCGRVSLYKIVASNGMVLEVDSSSSDQGAPNGTAIVTSHDKKENAHPSCRRQSRQLWLVIEDREGHHEIFAWHNFDKRVDVAAGQHDDDAKIILWESNGHDNQLFRLKPYLEWLGEQIFERYNGEGNHEYVIPWLRR